MDSRITFALNVVMLLLTWAALAFVVLRKLGLL